MRTADSLIAEIAAASRIPSARRRREVVRELRSHVADFVLHARDAGHTEEEIHGMILDRFGDPRQFSRNFAWVYRRERALLHASAFLLSSAVVAPLIATAVLAVQAGVAVGFGVPVLQTIAGHHAAIEALDIAASVTLYLGALSFEKLFRVNRSSKAAALLAAIVLALLAASSAAGLRAPYLVFGLVNALFLRAVQNLLKQPAARFGLVAAAFATFGALMRRWCPSGCTSWLIVGAGYQFMTYVAERLDRTLTHRLQHF
jgi:hypothetical protein